MKPRTFLLIAFLAHCGSRSAAQSTTPVDSLRARLARVSSDTLKLRLLHDLIDATNDADHDVRYTEELGALALSLSDSSDPDVRRIALDHRAWYEYLLGTINPKEGPVQRLAHFKTALDLLGEEGDPNMRSRVLDAIIDIHINAGNFERSEAYVREALVLSDERKDIRMRIDNLGDLSMIAGFKGDFPGALHYCEEALRSAEMLADTAAMIGRLLSAVAYCNMIADTASANAYSLRAVLLARRVRWQARLPEALINRGAYLSDQGREEEAATMYQEVLEGCRRLEADQPETRVDYYKATALYNLAGIHMRAGRTQLAAREIDQALDLAWKDGGPGWVRGVAMMSRMIHKAAGNTARALEMAELEMRMRDSVDLTAMSGKLERFEFEKELLADSLRQAVEKARTEAAHGNAMHRERERRNILLFSVIGVLLTAGALWYQLRSTRRSREQIRQQKEEAELQRQRAEQSERFKQQFLANMSHEIRTPMNAIMGMSGILKRNEHTPEQEKYLSAIAQSSENLLVILNDILDLSKLEAGKIELEKVPFDPRQVIGNVRDILRFKAEEKGIALVAEIANEVPTSVLGDPTRLNQIVLNLAGNAVKFTERGSVTVRARWMNDELRIDVIDTGIGIPQDRLDRIFEEFTQAYSDTTRKYGGTGLGLTISKRLAEMQGGGITVSSEQGKGSTFTVRIPYAMAPSDTQGPSTSRHSPPTELRNLSILLAEDNDFNVMVAQDELADAIPGVVVDVAANGHIAVEMAQANAYDVILMDVQMPEMNGYDATKAIRALPGEKSRIPILAMTANVMKEEVERCKEAGMDGYVPKPFKREELIGAIITAIGNDHDATL